MSIFTLEIRLGNAAMADGRDVADALRDVADALNAEPDAEAGRIRDGNGNTVGQWVLR